MGILELAMFSLLDGTFTKYMESTPPRNVSICQSSYKQMTIGELIKPRVFEAIKMTTTGWPNFLQQMITKQLPFACTDPGARKSLAAIVHGTGRGGAKGH